MKRILALAILAAAIPAARAEDAGSYEGKSAAEWLKTLGGKDEKERARAASALARIGKPAAEAIPALAKALTGSPKNENLRVNAALALGKIGAGENEDWKSHIPNLPKPPGVDPGSDPVPAPAPAPAAPDPAAEKLSESLRKVAVPALVKALSDPVTHVRVNAARSLGLIGPDAAEAAKALLRTLGDKDGSLRANAAVALAAMPEAAEDAVPALAKLLSDSHTSAANAAANALKARGAKALAALKAVEDALGRDLDHPRFQGPAGLAGLIGKNTGGGAFGSPPPLGVNLCLLLGSLGKDAAPALSTLFKALKASHAAVRNAAIQAVGSIRADPEKSVAALVGSLADELEANRGLAAIQLAEFGPDARSALPALEKFRDASEGTLRQNAQYAIDMIGGKAVATGEGAVPPALPGGMTTHGGSGGDTTEVWR
jgi:HEAT repeat protein